MSKIKGKNIIFSGTFEGYSRKDLEKLAENNGANLLSSVTKKLDFFIFGEDVGPAKVKKVEEFNIPMINLEEFLSMLEIKEIETKVNENPEPEPEKETKTKSTKSTKTKKTEESSDKNNVETPEIKKEETNQKSGISGKLVLFSGTFPGYSRKDLESLATSNGAILAGSVNKKLELLIAGEDMGPSKLDKANQLGVPIINLEKFLKLINGGAESQTFNLDSLNPEDQPEKLLTQLQNIDFNSFQPKEHGYKLRNFLQKHESKHGVTEVHLTVSEAIRKHLLLMHPYGHDDVIEYSLVSPDKKYLATGSWSSETYERGGVLQIWEIETGRIVNRLRIHGGVGWPDDKGMEWHPDSQLLAMAFDTNGIGVWDPFQEDNDAKLFAYVTDGMDHPPFFTWSNDGKRIFIRYNIDWENNQDENMGCWILTENRLGDVGRYAKPGLPEEKETKANIDRDARVLARKYNVNTSDVECFSGIDDILVTVSQDTVSFFQSNKIQIFKDDNPAFESPLLVNGQDLGLSFIINPAFGYKIKTDEHWGLAFEKGAYIASEDFEAEKHLNYSLGRQFSWPLNWVKTLKFIDLYEAVKFDKAYEYFGYRLINAFNTVKDVKKAEKKSNSGKNVWPPIEGKTVQDLFTLSIETLSTLSSGWSHHKDEYLTEVGIDMIRSEQDELIFELIDKISDSYKSHACAEFYFYASQMKWEASKSDKMLDIMEKNLEFVREAAAWPYISKAYFIKGNQAKHSQYYRHALETREKEYNKGQNTWPCLDMILFCDGTEAFEKHLSDFHNQAYDSHFSKNTVFNIMSYLPLKEILKLSKLLSNYKVLDYRCSDWLAQNLIKNNTPEYLNEACEIFENDWDKNTFINAVLEGLIKQNHPNRIEILQKNILELSEYSIKRLQWLANEKPELAKNRLESIAWDYKKFSSFAYYADGKIKLAYEFSSLVHSLGISEKFDKDFNKSDDNFLQTGYNLGKIACLEPEKRANHVLEIYKSCSLANHLKRTLLATMSAAIFKFPFDQLKEVQTQLREEMMKLDKDLGMEEMISMQGKVGDLIGAYQTWMKIPKGTRRYRVDPLLKCLVKTQNFDGLYSILMSLDANDLNERGQNSVRCISTLFNGRSYVLNN